MSAPKAAGIAVILLFASVIIYAFWLKVGTNVFAGLMCVGLVAFLLMWSIGAIIYNEWWPFRHIR